MFKAINFNVKYVNNQQQIAVLYAILFFIAQKIIKNKTGKIIKITVIN